MLVLDPEQADQERLDAVEQRNWIKIREDNQRNHELNMRQLKLDNHREVRLAELNQARDIKALELKGMVTRSRAESRRAIILALVKLPVLPFALLMIFILNLFNKEVPESLEVFTEL